MLPTGPESIFWSSLLFGFARNYKAESSAAKDLFLLWFCTEFLDSWRNLWYCSICPVPKGQHLLLILQWLVSIVLGIDYACSYLLFLPLCPEYLLNLGNLPGLSTKLLLFFPAFSFLQRFLPI